MQQSKVAQAIAGLSEAEAQARRAAGQGNTAVPPTSRSYARIVVENVFTFINVILFALGLALLLLGRPLDALVSTGVIMMNVVVSVVQEVRAKRTLDRIALLTRPTAAVVRAGRERTMPPEEIVLGDTLKVSPGDQIVVDGRIVSDGRMDVDESLLTGESNLVPKRAGDPVYSGTYCAAGTAYYVAEKVGAASLANQITAGARAFRRILTPLQREIYLVIRVMLVVVLYCELLLFFNAIFQRIGLAQGVQNSTIVASLVPNGLFLSISVAYALGALRIVRFGALVQQANAIESLSHVDTLCMDKTGTLTANRLQVQGVVPLSATEDELGRALGALAANTTSGNKTSEAIAAAYPGLRHRVVGEVSFSSARKWSALAFDDGESGGEAGATPLRGIYALGAPEMLRPFLATDDAAPGLEAIAEQAAALTEQGLRVLLVAHARDPRAIEGDGEGDGDASRLPSGMIPLGLVSLSDELRPEAREAVAAFRRAGVRLKIISGDSPETVAALAKQAGLGPEIALVSGLDLTETDEADEADEADVAKAVETATVFGRITPHQKEKLVRALRGQGHYVAMIGDGVNDVLSLKQADIGIAMRSGSQAARGVADIVLMEDSFGALAPAVEEGQRIVNGMQHILKLFMTRIGTVGLVIFSSLVIGVFPLAVRQGSLITLFSVGIPSVLLAVWARPGPRPQTGLFPRLVHFVAAPLLVTSVLALAVFYGTLWLELYQSGALVPHVAALRLAQINASVQPTAQSALATFLVFSGLFLVIFVEPPTAWWTGGEELSGDRRPALLAVSLMVVFVLLSLIPTLRGLFALTAIDPQEIAVVALAVVVWLFLVRWFWRGRLLARFVGAPDA